MVLEIRREQVQGADKNGSLVKAKKATGIRLGLFLLEEENR